MKRDVGCVMWDVRNVKGWFVTLGLILIFIGNALTVNADRQPAINKPRPSSIFHLLSSIFPPSSILSLSTDGTKLYEFWCSTCHGDRGQGLTAEWRAQWPEGKQNCWQAKCHAASHPPDGFIFPKNVPALIGPNTLAKFPTAQDLYVYTRAAMPYWSPNLLADDEYRAITIFLVKANYAARDLPAPAELPEDLSTVSLSSQPQPKTEIPAKAKQSSSLFLSTPNPQPPTPNPLLAASSYLPLLWIPLIALGGIFILFLAVRISTRSQ